MRRRKGKDPEEVSFWQSYSDMMAALLLVFVLIIACATYSANDSKSQAEELKAQYEQLTAELQEQQDQLEESQDKLEEQEEKLQKQQEQLDQLVGVKAELIQLLKDEFNGTDMNISVDPETGAISFDSSILFDFNTSELKPSGKEFLNKFFPAYFNIILSDGIRENISEVIIEGHTDSEGDYLYNLQLSQERAFSVAEYCLGENNSMFSASTLKEVRTLVTANGRSSNDLIYKDAEKKQEDPDASRRVEIKFRLAEDEMIKEMSEILEE